MFNKKGITLHLMDGDRYSLSNLDRQYFNSFGNKAEVTAQYIMSQPSVFLKIKHYNRFYKSEYDLGLKEDSLVICAADNHWTRIILQASAKKLKNVIFFSGGNEYTDGNVQFFVHSDGKLISGDYIETYHQELKELGEMPKFGGSCDSKSDPQLLITNLNVATIMLNTLWTILEHKLPEYSEIYFDVIKNTSKPIVRKDK